MKRSSRRNRFLFVVLVASVLALGALLHNQGDLINPLQSTTLLLSLSSGDAGFAMAGEERPLDAEDTAVAVPVTTRTDTGAADDSTAAATTGTLTLETLTAELAAAGVDVEAVSATMSAEGRSLENLLSVVNGGRVSVADLAARLAGETAEAAPAPEASSTALFDLRWEDFGSVLYDLWIILVATVGVIVVGRPVGWLLKRLRRTPVTVS